MFPRVRELFQTALEAIERTHAAEFVLSLGTQHAGILDKLGSYLGGPYVALLIIVVCYIGLAIFLHSRNHGRRRSGRETSPAPWWWLTVHIKFSIRLPRKHRRSHRATAAKKPPAEHSAGREGNVAALRHPQ